MVFQDNQDIINQPTQPTIMETGHKSYFYCFPLEHLQAQKTFFPTLSEMLEFFYLNLKNLNNLNSETNLFRKLPKKEINKNKQN